MPCESCNVQFTIFKHKKSCSECRRLFCPSCLEKTRKRSLCSRCVIFNKRPISRTELHQLKARDLIVYLQSKHIPTADCIEKEELINLVLNHVESMTGGASPSSNSSGSMPSPGSQFDNLRSYFNNLTSQPPQHQSQPNPPHPLRPPRQSSRDNSSTFFGSGGSNENPFSILRQGCQVILDNVTDKLATNFKFDPSQATSSRNSTSQSSATSPSTSTQIPPQAAQNQSQSQSQRQRQGQGRENVQNQSSPAEENRSNGRGRPTQSGSATRPKPKVPLDNIRVAESGCECSDDEESKLQRTTSQSTSNLLENPQLAVPGTSGCQRARANEQPPTKRPFPLSQSKASTLSDSSEFSSFEELNAITVEKSKPSKAPSELPHTDLPGASQVTAAACPSHATRIQRRRSDSCLHSRIGGDNVAFVDVPETKVQPQHGCCARCGRKKNELRKRLKRFHDQLLAMSTDDSEVRQHLQAILAYLERKRVSVLSSNGEDSVSEPVVVTQPGRRDEAAAAAVEPPVAEPKPETVVYKRRFVQLDDIKSSADLDEFSVKQLKEILVLNRVDFKGCCEKKELIERVKRLLDDYHSCPSVDKLQTDELCKICMDAPIECVILECGHMATCTNCGKVLSECPICRQFIIRVVRFFRA